MIKSVSLDDLEYFNKLGLQVNDNFINLFNLEDIILSEYEYLFGYYLDNKLVGFIHLTKSFEIVDIINVVVDSNYRRKGIANELIKYCMNYFADVVSFMLEVNVNNVSAISLYEKNNFKVIHKREKYYGNDDALIMKRDV